MIIVPRAEWGAQFPRGFGPAPLPAREVWLHHTVTRAPAPNPPAECSAMHALESIGHGRFGGGVSYTFLVMPSGRVYEGHGVDRLGAHTVGHNSAGRGIALVGNYDTAEPSAAMLTAVVDLLRHGHGAGWWTTPALTGGHRDVKATACPGNRAYVLIGELNRRAALVVPDVRRPLAYGAKNDPEVAKVQAFLARVFPSYAGALPATGNYLVQTANAVAEFQKRSGIMGADADGRTIGPRTWAALVANGYR